MSNENTKTEAAAKTVDDISTRQVFTTIEEALAYVGEISTYKGFDDLQQAIVGYIEGEDGSATLDPAIYDDSMHVAVALVSEKDTGAKKMVPVGFVVYPTPNPEAVAESQEGAAWIAKLVEKEANLVAMRQLRKRDSAGNLPTYVEAVDAMPTTLAAYITPTRESATGILASFEAVWRDIKKLMGQRSRAWSIANFSKKELRKAMESASYAAGTYPRVEKKGGDSSLFVFALTLGKVLCEKHKDEDGNPQPLDTEWFDKALAERDSHQIDLAGDDDELDLDDILAAEDEEAEEESQQTDDE